MNIADIFYGLRARGGPQLERDLKTEGEKAGTSFGASLMGNIRKSWSGAEIGKGLVAGLGLAGGLGAAKLLAEGVGAVKDAIVGTVTSAMDFEKAMLNVNSITKATDKQLADMSEQVLQLAGDFGQSSTTMAEGLYDISSSGFQGAEAMKVLEAATEAATAGLSTTAQSASGITAVLNAYGKSADDAAAVSDVLFQTVNRGVISFPELSDQIGKTTALAAPLGVSLEEVAAATALMTRNGVGAEETFTQINAVMNSMLMPSKQAAELAAELGLEWNAAGLRANGLAGQMSKLVEATGGSEEKMALLLGDSRAVRGAFVLAKNAGKDLNAELAIMRDSAGATASAFEEQSKSTAFHLAKMQAKIEAAQIEIGKKLLPIIATLADVATDNLVPALSDVADTLGAVTDAGRVLGDVLGSLSGSASEAGSASFDLLHAAEDFLAIMNPTKIENTLGLFGDILDNLGAKGVPQLDFVLHNLADTVDGFLSQALTTVTGDVEYMADHSADEIEGLRASAAPDLGAVEGALDGVGDEAKEMAYKVVTSAADAAAATEKQRADMVSALQGMIDGFFDPIETRYDLSALQAEQSENRKRLAQAKTKKASKTATEAIIRNLDDQAGKLEDLAQTGDLTAEDIDKFEASAKASYKSMGRTIPPELQKVISKLRTIVGFDGRQVDVDVVATWMSVGGGPAAARRQHGGPVEAHTPYLVGEKRAEVFVPGQAGYVYPSVGEGLAALGGATTSNQQSFTINLSAGSDVSPIAARRFGQQVLDVVADGLREQTARMA